MSFPDKEIESLWAPWRVEYYERDKSVPDTFLEEAAQTDDDEAHLVVDRGKSTFLIMNAYPYSSGHLMAVPYRKVSRLSQLHRDEKLELLEMAEFAEALLERVVKAQGFNIGLNCGSCSGAGVADHLHLHIVPRWSGDHNFMTVLGDTRIIPEGLKKTYQRLVEARDELRKA
jgi:ATP adenylyltransferase